MVLGNNTTKKPTYTVTVESKHSNIQAGTGVQSKTTPQPVCVQSPLIKVENMTMEQLISSYHKTNDEVEPMLPGFKYVKNIKNTIKSDRIKSVLKR